MRDPYDDHELMEWVENASRQDLELQFMNLVSRYRILQEKHKELQYCSSWEHTARQQERSGGWM